MSREAVLIHGWDPQYYTNNLSGSQPENIAWSRRGRFIELLQQRFITRYYNLPGFCGRQAPDQSAFNIEDFTDDFYHWIQSNGENTKLIIGFSFGGVIALDFIRRYHPDIPAVLVSPALVRQQTWRSNLGKLSRDFIPAGLYPAIKLWYQQLTSAYFRQGDSFIKASYDTIARRDVSSWLSQIDPGSLLLIYGSKDSSTPWTKVEKQVVSSNLDYYIVAEGEHNIGQTHPEHIINAIVQYLHTYEVQQGKDH